MSEEKPKDPEFKYYLGGMLVLLAIVGYVFYSYVMGAHN